VKALRATVSSVFRLLMLLVGAVGQIEVRICPPFPLARSHCHLPSQIRAELPRITEDSVAQVSRDKHASLADIFSLAVEDIPPMLVKHTTAVGLHVVLLLLDFVETKDAKYAELCQMMRSYIASYLTDDEREQFLS
jgi:hypothetical protein